MKKCSKCEVEKDESEFYLNKRTQRLVAQCLVCDRAAKKAYREANKDKIAVAQREWQKANPQRLRDAHDRWKARNPGKAAERAKVWYSANKEKARVRDRAAMKALKDMVYAAYGGYVCRCCGETTEQFLSIDHVNNDGANHRKDVERRKLYHWLRDNNFPDGFQVLCMNCNFGKARNNGICPHQTSEGSTTSRKAYAQAGGNAEPLQCRVKI